MFRKTLPILVLYLVTILFSVYYGLYDKDITIDYSSSIISTNLMVVLLCTVTLIVALWLVYKLLQKVLTSPLALWNSFVNGRKTKDFELLANALALAAVKEYDDAKLLTEEVDASLLPVMDEVSYLVHSLNDPSYAEKSDAYLINFYNSAKDAYRKNNLAVLEDAYKFFKTKFPKLNISRKISNMMHEVKARSLYSNNQLTEASKYLDGFAISSDTAALGILQAEIELELKNRIKALNILAEVWEHKPSYEVFSLILTAMEMDSNIQRAKKLQDFFEEVNQNKNIGLLVSVSFLLDENLIEPAEKIFEHTKDDGTKIYNYVKSYMFIAQQNALGAGKILSKLIKEI